MLHLVKKKLYFVVAGYLAFWARYVLKRWQPRILLITGSSGKTTLLHLVEAQLGAKAIYSHHANSAIGLPFHILGMEPNVENRWLWPWKLIQAPFRARREAPNTKLYVVEADCDRPREGRFLAALLNPEVVLWVSVYRTHSMNFDPLVKAGKFPTHEAAIAYEFGHFAARAQRLVAANADQPELVAQLNRAANGVRVEKASLDKVKEHRLVDQKTRYKIDDRTIHVPGLHHRELGISLQLVDALLAYLGEPLDKDYKRLEMPPSRNSLFAGKKGITIVDSTYNTGLGAMTTMLKLFELYPSEHKWLVLGDILEQGSLEQVEHRRLADIVADMEVEQVIFLGPRTKKYAYSIVRNRLPKTPVVSFSSPKEVLDYMQKHLKGGETILFKGGRFLEGVIEQLLANPSDSAKLARREPAWIKRRQSWGLPR